MTKHSPYAKRQVAAQMLPAPSLDINEFEDDANPARVANVPAATPRKLTRLAGPMPFVSGIAQQAAFGLHLFVLTMMGFTLFAPLKGDARDSARMALTMLGVLELVAMPLSLYLAARGMIPGVRALWLVRHGRLCRGRIVEASTEGLRARLHHFTAAFRTPGGHEGKVRFQRVAKLEDARTYLAEHNIRADDIPVVYAEAAPERASSPCCIGIEFDEGGVGHVTRKDFARRLILPALTIGSAITFIAVALVRLAAR